MDLLTVLARVNKCDGAFCANNPFRWVVSIYKVVSDLKLGISYILYEVGVTTALGSRNITHEKLNLKMNGNILSLFETIYFDQALFQSRSSDWHGACHKRGRRFRKCK